MWCKKEIETFISMHGRDKIFAVLAEGEPHESFPEEILYREEQVQYPDGTVGTRLVPVEPLAADVRGKNKKEILKAMDVEVLRILAPMLGVEFDDLRQRHRERKFKKIITATVAAAVLCLGIGIASTITALHINKQKEKIEAQSVEIQAQADEIASQSDAIAAQNEQLLNNQAKNLAAESLEYLEEGDREKALEVAVNALTEYEGLSMPYTPEARYALSESLYHYDIAKTIKPVYQMVMSGTVMDYCLSPDESTIAAVDNTGQIGVWDLTTGDKLGSIFRQKIDARFIEEEIYFLDNKYLIYNLENEEICKYNIETGQVVAKVVTSNSGELLCDKSGKYVISKNYSGISIYSAEGTGFKEKATIVPKDGYNIGQEIFVSEDGVLVYYEEKNSENDDSLDIDVPDIEVTEEDSQTNTEDELTNIMVLYSLNEDASILEIPLKYNTVNDIKFDGNYMYCSLYSLGIYEGGFLQKIDMSTGDIVWEVADIGLASQIILPEAPDGHLVVHAGLGLYYINTQTGVLERSTAIASSVAGINKIPDSKQYEVFFKNGEYGHYLEEYGELMVDPSEITHNFQELSNVGITDYGYIFMPNEDNKLVFYESTVGEDIVQYTGEEEWNIALYEENPEAVIENINSDKAALMDEIIYSDDKKLMFIAYTDDTLEIYDSDTKECLVVIEDVVYGVSDYYGKDKDGNIYVSNLDGGLIIDSEFNLIGRVPGMVGMDAERNIVIVEAGGYRYAYPIYSTEEMIRMGMEIVK